MKRIKSAGNRPTGSYDAANRWKHRMLLCLAAIGVGLTISACDFRKVDATAETTSKKESNMESIQAAPTIQNKIPPIDAAAVAETATATFALG